MELKRMRIGKLLGLAVALAILALALAAGNQGQGGVGLGQAQEEPCTVTLAPGQSIQEAINAASPGDVICLGGWGGWEWRENLFIWKDLTLRGAGREKSVIKSWTIEDWPVVQIESRVTEIEVTIEGLTITGAVRGILIGLMGSSKAKVIIRNSKISGNGAGILMGGSSQAEISGSIISGNGWSGIWMGGSSQATIHGNKIFENEGYGVALEPCSCIASRVSWVEVMPCLKFEGKVEGSENEIHDNGMDVCPSELRFLKTSQGGCYGPKC